MGMRRNFSKALDFVGAVAASGNPKVFLDGGPTYDELTFNTNLAAGEFTVIVEVDGDKRVEITGQQMLDREAYDGRPVTSGKFVLSFVDAVARTIQGENLTGLVTQPGQRVLVSVVIAASVTPGTPTLTMDVVTSPNRAEEFRLYVLPELVPVTTTGDNQFSGFRRGTVPETHYMRRSFGYGPVTYLEVEQDRRQIYGKGKMIKAANDAYLKRNGKTVPTSSTCFVFDPVVTGNVITDMLDTFSVEALRFTYTTSATTNITALTEYVHDVRVKKAA